MERSHPKGALFFGFSPFPKGVVQPEKPAGLVYAQEDSNHFYVHRAHSGLR